MKNKKNKYIERTGMYHYQEWINGTKRRLEYVNFIPNITIECQPPYIKGQKDSGWIKYTGKLDVTNYEQCCKLLGMTLQPI